MATIKSQKSQSKFSNFIKKHRFFLSTCFLIIFFFITFLISVSGGLRVFFPYIGKLTGFPFSQKTYLLVFQNNNELRPGGGFISSFATIKLQNGFLTKLKIEDVYGEIDDHDRIISPYPMEDLLADQWYQGYSFRDGNFSPNWPDSAQELIKLYNITRPEEKIDGVISINFKVLEELLKALGPLKVDDKWISKDNLFEEVTNQVNDIDLHDKEQLNNRKSILKSLSNAIIKKIVLNPFKLRKVSDVITKSMILKDLQLYFVDNNLQKLVVNNGWAGQWPNQVKGDFFAVMEANLGGLKSDRYLTRHITYHLKLSEKYFQNLADPEATVTVELQHFGIENIPLSGPYRGFFQIYNNINQKNTAFEVKKDVENRPIEEITTLLPGEKISFTKTYTLSKDIVKDNIYSLFIPKQSGTKGDIYTIIIELPRGYQTESNDFESRENFGFWQGPLNTDISLNLKIIEDKNPPRLIIQENNQLNKISLHFNEDLNQDFASDPFSYQITDLDIKHPEKTDQITIRKVETTSKDVFIYLNGQTEQFEERYGVRLKNLRDTYGNILSDRQITVVQRLK